MTTPEPSARLRAALVAALARPVLLEPRAVDAVLAGSAFEARADSSSDTADPPFVRAGDVAVVAIDGPLAQRAWSCMGMFGGDGYDAIEARVRAALADVQVGAVVLRVDSPGGEVAGCFEAVRAIRAAAADARKPLVAYADELACSAAYALACACDAIVLPDTGAVGSVGVIAALTDESAALAAEGLAVHLITSGAAKADGHPAVPLSADARARIQAEVDYLADVFALEVGAARGMAAADVRALEARVLYGPQAVAAGLADQVGNLQDAITRARVRAARQRTTAMNAQHHAQLGLAADAAEPQITARLTVLTALEAHVLATTGTASAEEARGALRVQSERAAKAEELATELAAVRAETTRAERIALKLQGLAAGVLAPADLDTDGAAERAAEAAGQPLSSALLAQHGTEVDWLAAMGNKGVRSYVERRQRAGQTVVPVGETKAPAGPPTADAQLPLDVAALAAKGWKALTADEKHAVTVHDKKLADRLRREAL